MSSLVKRHSAIVACVLLAVGCAAEDHSPIESDGQRSETPTPVEKMDVDGLVAEGEILVDEWGVAHIYADASEDVYFLQGFNAARDRLWQIDYWRRRGLGRLAQAFGPEFVEHDKAARLFLYRGPIKDEWAKYGPNAEAIATSFVDGVNAYVDLAKRDPALMPREFKEGGYTPELWAPEDIVRIRAHGLSYNVKREVARARTLCEHGEAAERLRFHLQPQTDYRPIPREELCAIPEDVLATYLLAKDPVDLALAKPEAPLEDAADEAFSEGSNNWAISPGRSETGRAVLANDPHRTFSLPSLRYLVHVEGPEDKFIGAGEPFAPGVSIGHNGAVGFGLTVFAIDHEDLYYYEIHPDDLTKYKYRDEWVSFTSITESIDVKDGEPVRAELLFTRHGPVVRVDADARRAYAIRSVQLAPGAAAYLGSWAFLSAGSSEELDAALEAWGAPGENMVFADTAGAIGWRASGLSPVRENWDGLLPVAGDGRFEWSGIVTARDLPNELSPPRGWIATANAYNVPEDFPHDALGLAHEWSSPDRIERISDVLSANDKTAWRTSQALQTDFQSTPGREAAARVNALLKRGELQQNDALSGLAVWDGDMSPVSREAPLFFFWTRVHLPKLLFEAVVGKPAPADFQIDSKVIRIFIRTLSLPKDIVPAAGEVTEEDALEILETSLLDALEDLEDAKARLNKPQLVWSDLMRLTVRHPMAGLYPEAGLGCAPATDRPWGGDRSTVNVTFPSETQTGFESRGGPSVRIILDVGAWDNSLAMNMPGQSGDPQSANYCGLMDQWTNNAYFPLLFSRSEIERHTQRRIVLTPR
ncbi:MAG: penicillin acylase family protein [Pseudomonadota bacterium]